MNVIKNVHIFRVIFLTQAKLKYEQNKIYKVKRKEEYQKKKQKKQNND